MNPTAITVGAVAVGGAAVALDAAAPKGAEVGHGFEPLWSRALRRIVTEDFDLDPVPGSPYGTVPAAVVAEWARLAHTWGTITVGGDTQPNVSVDGLAGVAGAWARRLTESGALALPAAQRWVSENAVAWAYLGRMASADTYDPVATKTLRRELAALATELDDPRDSFVPANPDNRTYWDFLYERAKSSTPLKLAYAPFYVPYKAMELAWDHLPGIASIATDVFGPAAKMIVTTFGVVIVVGGVGLYAWHKLAPKVTVAP